MTTVEVLFKMSLEECDRLHELAIKSEATMGEIVSNAMEIFEWIIEETKAGKKIYAIDYVQGEVRVLDYPLLNRFKNE